MTRRKPQMLKQFREGGGADGVDGATHRGVDLNSAQADQAKCGA